MSLVALSDLGALLEAMRPRVGDPTLLWEFVMTKKMKFDDEEFEILNALEAGTLKPVSNSSVVIF